MSITRGRSRLSAVLPSLAPRQRVVCDAPVAVQLPAQLLQARLSSLRLPFDIAEEVRHALARSEPVVALETAIVSHGLPSPHAHQVPIELERIIRANGATPATIGVVGGRIKIGLTEAEIERLAEPGRAKMKVGRRELAAAMVKGIDGGTTVSGTMVMAHLAGIKIFVTGGIGGVHRGAERSFDVSSDLTELGRTPVAVICAGAKSILDIGLTLEYLETQGVTVTTYGSTTDFPAFYSPKSGFHSGLSFATPAEAAQLIHASAQLDLRSGILFGVPIPAEHADDAIPIQRAVEQAVAESEKNGVAKRGKEVTPWLLDRVRQLTRGQSIASNIALIKNNAEVGAKIARAYAELQRRVSAGEEFQRALPLAPPRLAQTPSPRTTSSPDMPILSPSPLMIVGASALDITARADSPLAHTTSPGTVALTPGGVARNIAEAAHRLGVPDVMLVSPVGDDPLAAVLSGMTIDMGMKNSAFLPVLGAKTAVCNNVLDEWGALVGGVADMGITQLLPGDQVIQHVRRYSRGVVAFDGNLTPALMSRLLEHCVSAKLTSFFEPTSNVKAIRFVDAIAVDPLAMPLTHIAPNRYELRALYDAARDRDLFDSPAWFAEVDKLGVDANTRSKMERRLPGWVLDQGLVQMAIQLLPCVRTLWIKCAEQGLLVVGLFPSSSITASDEAKGVTIHTAHADQILVIRHFPALPLPADATISATGAGDTLAGALLAQVVQGETTLEVLVDRAQRAALQTLQSPLAVAPSLSLS